MKGETAKQIRASVVLVCHHLADIERIPVRSNL